MPRVILTASPVVDSLLSAAPHAWHVARKAPKIERFAQRWEKTVGLAVAIATIGSITGSGATFLYVHMTTQPNQELPTGPALLIVPYVREWPLAANGTHHVCLEVSNVGRQEAYLDSVQIRLITPDEKWTYRTGVEITRIDAPMRDRFINATSTAWFIGEYRIDRNDDHPFVNFRWDAFPAHGKSASYWSAVKGAFPCDGIPH